MQVGGTVVTYTSKSGSILARFASIAFGKGHGLKNAYKHAMATLEKALNEANYSVGHSPWLEVY